MAHRTCVRPALGLRNGQASHRSFYARTNPAMIALEASDAHCASGHPEDALAETTTLDDEVLVRAASE